MANNLKAIQPGAAPMATDIDQIRMALSGLADATNILLPAQQTAPTAPTLALVTGSGSVNGAVKYQLVAITGWVDSYYNLYISGFVAGTEASITASNQTVNVTIPAYSAPIIGYAVYRTPAAGASGSEKYVGIWTNPAGGTFNDNIPDGTLGTGMVTSLGYASLPAAVPTTNTTGTIIAWSGGANSSGVPLYIIPPHIKSVGMDQYGNLKVTQPSQITTGNTWNVADKNGIGQFYVYLDGTTSPSVVSTKGYGGIGRVSAYNYVISSGSQLASGSSVTITHNLGYAPIITASGYTGNIELTFSTNSPWNSTTVSNWNSGSNGWYGTIYFW